MGTRSRSLSCADYHVAWICPLANVELLPARLMLDEEHSVPQYDTHYDENTYICGTINGHAVVIATCPPGETGNVNAGRLTGFVFKTFPNIRMAVLVGIGGGIPRIPAPDNPLDDIHLGDVVVGWPGDGKPACVYHDRGKSRVDEFEMVGTMQNPDWRLTSALALLASDHKLRRTKFNDQLERLKDFVEFAHPGLQHDRLFKSAYPHVGDNKSKCTACDPNELVQRPQRTEVSKDTFIFHEGRIATGNAVIRNGELRDQISARCDGAICVEMEAAGVDVNRRCLVIRGISDYADSHKNDIWRSHAAGKAAAFARELLCRVQPGVIERMEGIRPQAPWAVPFARNLSFVGREKQLAQLDEHILLEDCQRLAIYGLGGCGKTALALQSAYRTREQQPSRAIFWVPAVSRETFEQAYRAIGTLLHIRGIADDNADVKRLVNAKLSDESIGPWLLIIDNADDVGIFFDPLGDAREHSTENRLVDYIPHSRKGSIIFTTRTRKAAIDLAENSTIQLGELDAKEAEALLHTRLLPEHHNRLEDHQIVHEFLNTLTFFALAIVQAVAFINKNDISLSEYISCYRNSEADATRLLSGEFEDLGRYRDAKNAVAITWYISFEQIQKSNGVAAEYLSFMACLQNTNIPASILPTEGSPVERIEALGMLKAYAFITERALKTFDIHPLVHLAMRGWLKAHNQWCIWTEKALMQLIEIVPLGGRDTKDIWGGYLAHATHLTDLAEPYEIKSRISLLERIGRCEHTLGRYRPAERAYRQILERWVEELGTNHPRTLTIMSDVASELRNQGKYAEAEKMHRETLVLREKVLGKEHPDTLMSMNNVARAITNQGKLTEAAKMHQEVLALRKKVLGKDHPDTLTSMNNMAWALNDWGKYAEAEKIHRETLALRWRQLGGEHPHTLSSKNNLAATLGKQGKYKEAEELHRETLALRERVLGKEHPHTLTSMNNVAMTLSSQGKYAEAEKIHRKTLVLVEKVLGQEHPDTLTSMHLIAHCLGQQGEYEEAEKIHRKTLALREKVSGKDGRHTLASVWTLARLLSDQKRYEGALPLYERAYTGYRKRLGPDYPHTQRCLREYSSLRQKLGLQPVQDNEGLLDRVQDK